MLALRHSVDGGGYQLRAPIDHFEGVAQIGLVSQYAALEELFRWYGWPRDASSLGWLADVINEACPGTIVDVV